MVSTPVRGGNVVSAGIVGGSLIIGLSDGSIVEAGMVQGSAHAEMILVEFSARSPSSRIMAQKLVALELKSFRQRRPTSQRRRWLKQPESESKHCWLVIYHDG